MTIQLTAKAMREIFPRAPQDILDAFVDKQSVLDAVGITHTRTRLSVALSQVEHETNGYTIKDLTESTAYTHAGVARVWPSRFKSAEQVQARYGSAPGWQLKMLDDVYGGRMGNRPGTHDGSTFIGRGGPQWTGRDGYAELAKRLQTLVPGLAGLTADGAIAYAIEHKYQPEVLAAFWAWKNLNPVVDAGGLRAATKPWNGGYIGMADREARMAGNDPIIARLANVERIAPVTKTLPGNPPTPTPPKEVIDEATKRERAATKVGTGTTTTGVAGEVVKKTTTTTEQPPALLSPLVTYTLIGVGVVIVIVAIVLTAKKQAAVIKNWF